MSIRTNPMKAVPTLLKRLVSTEQRLVMTEEEHEKLKDLKSVLNSIKDLFSMVKRNEDELLDTLTVVDGYLRNSNIRELIKEKEEICKRISVSTQKLLPAGAIQTSNNIEVTQSSTERETFRALSSSPQLLQDLEMLKVNYTKLHDYPKCLFLSLLLFPENVVIKKRDIILWWTGEGEHANGEKVFQELFHGKLIVPHGQSKCPYVNKFKINPLVHHKLMRSMLQSNEAQFCEFYSQIKTSSSSNWLLALDKQKVRLSAEFGLKSNQWRGVLNVGASYLEFEPQWMAKMKSLKVLQLGRWLQDSASHHIEVESDAFLNELRDQKNLKHLSLRGISRIFELPPSIFQLESLETLDLKACHNLETLPNDISSLRNLRNLDLSKCYLLDGMPKGIEKLYNLEVLKGFVKGSSSKTPCRISDFVNFVKLKRLSIHIRKGAVIYDREFESLVVLSKLEHLKISWGVSDRKYIDINIILPLNLKKLHLEGFPGQHVPKWLNPLWWEPSKLSMLYITGGKLKSLGRERYANLPLGTLHLMYLKHLRLRYLQHLKVDLESLHNFFPLLRYIEIKQIQNCSYFEWSENQHK